MFAVVLAALLGVASARPQLPAGVSAAACPNYPFCGAEAPADFPTPVVNGEPIAPILNTNPAQTAFHQASQLAKSPAGFPVTVVDGENVAPGEILALRSSSVSHDVSYGQDTTQSPLRLTLMRTIS